MEIQKDNLQSILLFIDSIDDNSENLSVNTISYKKLIQQHIKLLDIVNEQCYTDHMLETNFDRFIGKHCKLEKIDRHEDSDFNKGTIVEGRFNLMVGFEGIRPCIEHGTKVRITTFITNIEDNSDDNVIIFKTETSTYKLEKEYNNATIL